MSAGNLIFAPIRGCHAQLGDGELVIHDVVTHNGAMTLRGTTDGRDREVTFPITSPVSQFDGNWVINTGNGSTIAIPNSRC